MIVVSLFDGISCGQQTIKKMGLPLTKYYASEINKESIKVTQTRHPNTIQIGDVEGLIKIDDEGNIEEIGDILRKLPKVDLLIGGSPCQGLSRAKTGRLNLKDPRSKLFYNYIAIRDWLIENNNPDLKWLLENVVPNKSTLEIMNECVGREAYRINSDSFLAQTRDRLYWTNIKVNMEELPERGQYKLEDYLVEDHGERVRNLKEEGYLETLKRGKNCIQWDTSGKGNYSQQNRARYKEKTMNCLPKANAGDKTRVLIKESEEGLYYRNLGVEEVEMLQGLPRGYTGVIPSKAKRKGLVGDAWTVDVIEWILNGIKE